MSKELTNRAAKAASKHLKQKGYEVIEDSWQPDESDSVYIIARDADETLVFCTLLVSSSIKDGLPEERDRKQARLQGECVAAQYLLLHSDDIGSTSLRFDEIALLLISDDCALARHKINCVNE